MRPLFLGTYARYAFIINFLRKKKYTKILEIGSGLFGIADYCHVTFTGIDTTTLPTKHRPQRMTFKHGDALHLDEEDNSYDFVFSTDMIEHIDQDKRLLAIEEAIRVSSDVCVIGFPCGELAQLHDDFRFQYFEKSDKHWRQGRHAWLIEHVEKGLPTYDDIAHLEKQLHNKGYSCNIVWTNTIVGWKNLISIEMLLLKRGYIGLGLSTLCVYIARLFRRNFVCRSGLGYRVFLVINKK